MECPGKGINNQQRNNNVNTSRKKQQGIQKKTNGVVHMGHDEIMHLLYATYFSEYFFQ